VYDKIPFINFYSPPVRFAYLAPLYTKRGEKLCLRGFGVSEKIFKNNLFQSKIETRYKKGKSAFTHTIYLGAVEYWEELENQ